MPAKDQKVTHDNETITISRPCFKSLAFASYTKELFEMISSVTWSVSRSKTGKEYIKSSKYGLLHQLVIAYFYGEDVLKEAYDDDYVIDHLDNNGYDCVYENLALIPKKENSAKGLTYDIERKDSIDNISINITRDFDTKEFQISVMFNKPYNIILNSDSIPIMKLYLRYGVDFKTAFIDARSILNDLNTSKMINLQNLRSSGFDYRKAEIMFAKHEEIESGFIVKDGQVYIVQGSPKARLIKGKHNRDIHKK
ncbi:MAG TPA: HNH endonuclease [Pseudobacteroides sp.]|nr:HNH endonuclease [Pseudobacteroides sp.]